MRIGNNVPRPGKKAFLHKYSKNREDKLHGRRRTQNAGSDFESGTKQERNAVSKKSSPPEALALATEPKGAREKDPP